VLDAVGRPLPFEYATTISGIATTLIGMQTWLDTREPKSGHWTRGRTLSRKWTTGTVAIVGLFGAAGAGVVLESSTLTLVGTVLGAWLAGQTYLDYRAGGTV